MKEKKSVLAAGILAVGFLMEFHCLMAEDINAKKESADCSIPLQTANQNIKAEILKSNDCQTPFPVLKDDVVNTVAMPQEKALFEDFSQFESSAAALSDEEVWVASDQKGITFPLSGQRIATFMLDISKLPKGYDINKIRTIAGLSPNRAYQKYKLFLSKVSTLDKFISMGIYEMDSLLRKV